MKIKRNILATLTIVIFGLIPAIGAMPAFAQTTMQTAHQNFFEGLVQFLASKFNLDQNQVSSAITDYKNQHKQTMQQNIQNREKSRLDKLVSAGKITPTQEQAITDELNKLRSELDPNSLTNETPQQRKDALTKLRSEFTSWAQSQDIDPKLIIPFGRIGMVNRGWLK